MCALWRKSGPAQTRFTIFRGRMLFRAVWANQTYRANDGGKSGRSFVAKAMKDQPSLKLRIGRLESLS